jgi:hypothetical protein
LERRINPCGNGSPSKTIFNTSAHETVQNRTHHALATLPKSLPLSRVECETIEEWILGAALGFTIEGGAS